MHDGTFFLEVLIRSISRICIISPYFGCLRMHTLNNEWCPVAQLMSRMGFDARMSRLPFRSRQSARSHVMLNGGFYQDDNFNTICMKRMSIEPIIVCHCKLLPTWFVMMYSMRKFVGLALPSRKQLIAYDSL